MYVYDQRVCVCVCVCVCVTWNTCLKVGQIKQLCMYVIGAQVLPGYGGPWCGDWWWQRYVSHNLHLRVSSLCILVALCHRHVSPPSFPFFCLFLLSFDVGVWDGAGGGGAVSVQAIMIPWCLRLIRVCHLCLCAGTIIISSEEGETEGMPLVFFVVCLSVAFAYDCLSDFVVKASVERNLACFTWKGTLEIC